MATRQLITDSDERKTRSRAATFVVPLGFAAAAGAALLAPTGTSHAAVTANDDTGMITPLLPDAQAVSARSANVSTSSRSASRSAVPAAQADASQDDATTPTADLPLDDPLTLAHAVAQAKDEADAEAAAKEAEEKAAAEKAAAEKAAAEKKAEAKKKAEEKAAAEKAAADKAAAEQAAAAKPDVVGTRYTTSGLNVRTGPSGEANVVDTLDPATKVSITDANQGNWQQIMYDGKARWVSEDYLAKSKPSTSSSSSSGGLSSSECSNGTTVLGGTGANGQRVHKAVCARFPSISTYGGNRGGSGNHGTGHAVDVMVSGSLGWEVANFLRANAKALGISELIYSQKIWTVQRSGEGWRSMSDRGSTTANHYDHVHVSTY